MTIRTLIGVGLTIELSGSCAAPSTSEDRAALMLHCRDPSTDCTHTNGTGVYVAEGGVAGLDTFHLLIRHFINEGDSVRFLGRYYDATLEQWTPVMGRVDSAHYGWKQWNVVSVSEDSTVPTWELLSTTSRAPTHVTGKELLDLKLYISVPITSHQYVLEFVEEHTFQDDNLPDMPPKPVVHAYRMRWRNPVSTSEKATDYCFVRSDGTYPDPVVFQQGIDVDPENGQVMRDTSTAGFVTMSCFRGSPATVYRWGYGYREPAPLDYFQAAIHMKRASYCADEHHYTTPDTQIAIWDDQGINNDNDSAAVLEAWWGEHGALCLEQRRHPDLEFNNMCNGDDLPSCGEIPDEYKKLKNGAEPLMSDP